MAKTKTPFEYDDYRLLLQDEFIRRTFINPKYSLRAYARDLNVSIGFLSDILHGNNDMSIPGAYRVFQSLGYKDLELEYIVSLLKVKKSKNPQDRQVALDLINQHNTRLAYSKDRKKEKYAQSKNHFIIYGLLENIKSFESLLSVTEKLDIPSIEVHEILHEFVKEEYVTMKNNEYIVTKQMFADIHAQGICEVLKHFTCLLIDQINKNGGISVPEKIAQCGVWSLDQQSYDLAVEAHKIFFKTLSRLSTNSKGHEKIVFSSEVLFTI